MTVYFRTDRDVWAYNFMVDGKRYNAPAKHPETGELATNKREAKAIEALIRAKILTAPPAPAIAPDTLAVAQAFAAFTVRKRTGRNFVNQKVYVREMLTFFGAETPIADITTQRVWDYIAWAREQPIMVYVGAGKKPAEAAAHTRADLYRPAKSGRKRADSTINRYLDCLRETLRIAYDMRGPGGRRMLEADMPKVPELAEPEHLPRPIADSDLQAIIAAAPAHLAEAVQLARMMGFRKGEIFALTVDQVDFDNGGVWLEAEGTKAQRAEFIAATGGAAVFLRRLVDQAAERQVRYLITFRHGKKGEWRPIKNPKRAWRTALKNAGVEGHVFHNTKASFVTAVAGNASAAVTQHLARHKDYRTTQRYLKVHDHVARAALEAASFDVAVGGSCAQDLRPEADGSGTMPLNPLENMVGAAGFEPTTPSPPEHGPLYNVLKFKDTSKKVRD